MTIQHNYAESLLDIKRVSVADITKPLLSTSQSESKEAGLRLVAEAARFGVSLKDFLTLSVESTQDGRTGYEQVLQACRLPVRNDFEHGITLQMASNSFQQFPGTRAMFPQVIDDMLTWQSRQTIFEDVTNIVANTRTVAGTELLSTIVLDDSNDRGSQAIAEFGRVPVKTVRTTEQSVKFFKHGSALRMSYEFNRRASLDILTPFANRIARELELSKCNAAVNLLINGYTGNTLGYAAAPVQDQGDLATPAGFSHTNGKLAWEGLLYWLVQRAKAGVPVDTIIGNWDAWFQWQKLMANPTTNFGPSVVQILQAAGVKLDLNQPNPLGAQIRFALSSAAADTTLIGITKGEAIEQLVEAGSQVSEQERSIQNQAITMVKTENTGFKLIWGDARGVYNYGS